MRARENLLDTPLIVVPREQVVSLHAHGVPAGTCHDRGCTEHSSDWRAPPGSPANRHRCRGEAITTIGEILRRRYTTPALVMGCVIVDRHGNPLSTAPRVSKDALPWLRSEGLEVMTTCFIADVDIVPHVPWTPEKRSEFDRQWATLPGLQTCGAYLSAKGYRLLQPLTEWIPVDEAEGRQVAWQAELAEQGVWSSIFECRDWGHLMRVPHHRKPSGAYESPWISVERMRAIDAPPARPGFSPRRRGPSRRTTARPTPPATYTIPTFRAEVPDGWGPVADALGAAMRDTVRARWRDTYLALAGALLERGAAPECVPAIIERLHSVDQSYPEWRDRLVDRMNGARSTVSRWCNGQEYTGYASLRRLAPAVADALDAMADGTEARVLAQLAVPPAQLIPAGEAVPGIQAAVCDAYGVVLIEATPGTGKTQAVTDHARSLPPIEDRAAPGARIGVSAPQHRLARQTAAKVTRSLHLFSPPSLLGEDGRPVCVYAESAKHLAGGGQSVRYEFCRGRGKFPCEHSGTCPAEEGREGDERANLITAVHGLARQLRAEIGVQGTLVIDEPGEVLFTERVTLDDLDRATRYLDAFVDRYARAIAPALAAWRAWVAELGPVDADELISLEDAIRTSTHAIDEQLLSAAVLDPEGYDIPEAVVQSAAGAIEPTAKSHAPPLTRRAVDQAKGSPSFAAEVGRASRVLDILWRGLSERIPFACRLDERSGDRACTVTGPNRDLAIALAHQGPVVILDASARVHVAAITKFLGGHAPTYLRFAVADGAPITRTILAAGSATRHGWMNRGVPEWAPITAALRAALAHARSSKSVGLMTWKTVAVALRHTLNPSEATAKEWPHGARALERAVDTLRPVLASFTGELIVGHYGAVEGLDHMADCDGTITLGDPRPNLGDERDKAEYLALNLEGRLDELAAAELEQAHGRLRTPHRRRPGWQLHVGGVVPGGWPGRAVTVLRMPVGRPKTTGGTMTADELRQAREASGLGTRGFARALGLSDGTVRRYESGERSIPEDVASAVRALSPSAPETPLYNKPYQGVSGAPSVQCAATGGFGRSEGAVPLQGVSGAPPDDDDPGGGGKAPRRARRIDLAGLLGTDGSSPGPVASLLHATGTDGDVALCGDRGSRDGAFQAVTPPASSTGAGGQRRGGGRASRG